MQASRWNHTDTVKVLLKKDANKDAQYHVRDKK